ncbi:major facilitator superfamily domain-containing protein [Multifurca ochricompacta]|uniref:Major facilitator superfamily domain-containing protein n=1 Tax=Multifurca ochricompacta TaxID=376703 RepID=A0AAD4M6F2_9AGAM|nr:major facilitator superfamily domain-containing protein [Multifurca ochricompacta]
MALSHHHLRHLKSGKSLLDEGTPSSGAIETIMEEVPLSNLVVNEHVNAEAREAMNSSHQPIPSVLDDFPEGGYGWVVVLACSAISFFFGGLTYSWGIVQARLTQSKLATDSELSFIGSTAITIISVAALINVRLIRWLGTRKACALGCFFLGLGPFLNGFALKSYGGLFLTNGLILGFGTSLTFMACSSLPSQYFKRRRGIANGLVFAGNGLGGGVITITLNSLIDRVGISWAFKILGLSTWFITIPASLLLRERMRRSAVAFEWGLFRDPKFVLLFFGSSIATFPLLVPPFFIPLYANSVGASASLASSLLAAFNLASAVGRVGFGLLGDSVGPITSLVLALTVNALSMLAIWPISSSVAPLVVFIVINGFGSGGFFSLIPSVVGSVYGNTRTANALAMTISGWAFGYFFVRFTHRRVALQAYGGSSAGRAAFRPAIYYAGSLAVASAGLIAGMRMLSARKLFAYA